jgi:integrase
MPPKGYGTAAPGMEALGAGTTIQNFYIVLPPAETKFPETGEGMLGAHPWLSLIQSAIPQLKTNAGLAAANPVLSPTFAMVANEWFGNNVSRWAHSYSLRLRGRLDNGLLDVLGSRPISEVGPLDVLQAVRDIEKRDALETARRVLRIAGAVFRYGVATGQCHRDPTTDLKGALKPTRPVRHRASLSAKELPAFLKALNAYDGEPVTGFALELIILTFVRTSELRFARWCEFENLDSTEALWRIPAERMKMRRPHLVPLSRQAVSVLRQLRQSYGDGGFLFPAKTKRKVISENRLLFALYRMGYQRRATVHGFRSTASTILNEAQFNPDWIEAQLAHSDSSVRGVYNSAEWLPGRRKMMCWWSDYLDRVRAGKSAKK